MLYFRFPGFLLKKWRREKSSSRFKEKPKGLPSGSQGTRHAAGHVGVSKEEPGGIFTRSRGHEVGLQVQPSQREAFGVQGGRTVGQKGTERDSLCQRSEGHESLPPQEPEPCAQSADLMLTLFLSVQ